MMTALLVLRLHIDILFIVLNTHVTNRVLLCKLNGAECELLILSSRLQRSLSRRVEIFR